MYDLLIIKQFFPYTMNDVLKIFVDHLKQGKVEKIDCTISSSFLEVQEPGLRFGSDVAIQGEVYAAGDELVIHLDIKASATIPCSICNEPVELPLDIKGFYYVEPLDQIRSGVFNMAEVIRETILLEVPAFAECCQGHCPQRKELEKYFKVSSDQEDSDTDRYNPFSDLMKE